MEYFGFPVQGFLYNAEDFLLAQIWGGGWSRQAPADPLISPSVPLAKKLSPSQPEPRRTPTTATGLFAQSQPAPSSICTQKHTLGFSDFSLASQNSPAHKKCLELRWFLFYRGERLSHLSCTLGFPPIPDLSASSLILKELTRLYSEGKLQGSNKPTIL